MRKKIAYILITFSSFAILIAVPRALDSMSFDERKERQHLTDLNTRLKDLDARYMKAIFESAGPAGFIAVASPRYVRATEPVAFR